MVQISILKPYSSILRSCNRRHFQSVLGLHPISNQYPFSCNETWKQLLLPIKNPRRKWRGITVRDCGWFSRWIQEINPKNLGNQVRRNWHMQQKKHRKMNRKHCVCYSSASYGVNAALDQGHFKHPKEDEGLLSHWQLGSRHWWLKWFLLQGSCQPLTLAAYRQLDAPGNHTESHQFVMTHARLYVKNILRQTGHFGLNSTEWFLFRILRTHCISASFTNGLTSSSA